MAAAMAALKEIHDIKKAAKGIRSHNPYANAVMFPTIVLVKRFLEAAVLSMLIRKLLEVVVLIIIRYRTMAAIPEIINIMQILAAISS